MIAISEVFASLQGEGPALGTPCVFVRTAGCPLRCEWCDSKFTWDWSLFDRTAEVQHLSSAEVVALALDCAGDHIRTLVLTGGEPMVQQMRLEPVLAALTERGWSIDVETAGTIAPSSAFATHVMRFVVSPKLASSGNVLKRRYRPEVLAALGALPGTAFKFVATGPEDLPEIASIIAEVGISPEAVYVMPEGQDVASLERHTKALWDPVMVRGWKLTTRIHILAWGTQRGV